MEKHKRAFMSSWNEIHSKFWELFPCSSLLVCFDEAHRHHHCRGKKSEPIAQRKIDGLRKKWKKKKKENWTFFILSEKVPSSSQLWKIWCSSNGGYKYLMVDEGTTQNSDKGRQLTCLQGQDIWREKLPKSWVDAWMATSWEWSGVTLAKWQRHSDIQPFTNIFLPFPTGTSLRPECPTWPLLHDSWFHQNTFYIALLACLSSFVCILGLFSLLPSFLFVLLSSFFIL